LLKILSETRDTTRNSHDDTPGLTRMAFSDVSTKLPPQSIANAPLTCCSSD
jgi:hypothetical protein